MEQIANNDRYEIEVDESKNRIYLTVNGFWQTPGNYVEDIRTASLSITPGFSVVADLRTMKAPSPEVGRVHERAQKILVSAGLHRTAEVHPESAITKMALNRYSKSSGMEKRIFSSIPAAEKWLDSA